MMCEKCWGEAFLRARIDGRAQVEHYAELLTERKDNPCTADEQAGIVRCPKHGVMYGYCSDCTGGIE